MVVWQFRGGHDEQREHQALRAIAFSFFALAAYAAVQSVIDLVTRSAPETMTPGIIIAALLTGLLGNPVLGRWWADPLVALVVASLATLEGSEAWQGETDDVSEVPRGVSLHTPRGTYRVGCMNTASHDVEQGIELTDATVADLQRRLRRVEGQVRGLQQMLGEGRDCRELVTQIAAANKALEQVGFVLVSAGLTWCLEDPDRSARRGYEVTDVQKMFLKLA